MSDEQFKKELELRAFMDQISGYPIGHPQRNLGFRPIVTTIGSPVDREKTLALACYNAFSGEERKALLVTP
jgi:hypothetical protein